MSTETPRTDAEHAKTLTPAYEYEGAETEAWEWARKLEKELAEARQSHIAFQMEKHMKEAQIAWSEEIDQVLHDLCHPPYWEQPTQHLL